MTIKCKHNLDLDTCSLCLGYKQTKTKEFKIKLLSTRHIKGLKFRGMREERHFENWVSLADPISWVLDKERGDTVPYQEWKNRRGKN